MQYVGETVQLLNKRLNWHKSGFRNPSKYSHCKILSKYLNSKSLWKWAKCRVKVIEKIKGTGRKGRRAIDPKWIQLKKCKETKLIQKHEKNNMKLKQIYGRIWGTKYIRSNIFNGREFIFKLIRNLITGICNAMNFVYIQIASLNKKSLKNLSTLFKGWNAKITMHVKFIQWFHLALDSIGPKMYKQKPPRIKRKPKNICYVAFSNKTIEIINLLSVYNMHQC